MNLQARCREPFGPTNGHLDFGEWSDLQGVSIVLTICPDDKLSMDTFEALGFVWDIKPFEHDLLKET